MIAAQVPLSQHTLGEADTGQTQTIAYDSFGNITSMTTDGAFQSLPTSSATNRLSLAGTTYDAAGNLTRLSLGGEVFEYEYDGVSMMRSLISNTDQAKVFLYDASDERIAVFECVTGSGASACATSSEREHWYVRDLDGKVLRSWEHRFQANGWTWREDNIFRNGQPLATLLNNGSGNDNPRHLHLDHLGTPRQITDTAGSQVAFHSYYPFGEEATDPNQDPLRLKLTGHERDKNGGGEGQLDYMHARYESPMIGRFLSVDRLAFSSQSAPQGWNRYTYVLGNPLRFIDQDGLSIDVPPDYQSRVDNGNRDSADFMKIFGVVNQFTAFRVANKTNPKAAPGRLCGVGVSWSRRWKRCGIERRRNDVFESRLHDQRCHADRITVGSLLDWDFATDAAKRTVVDFTRRLDTGRPGP